MASLLSCPKCESQEFHRSHVKNILEKLRRSIFKQSPYRCHECNHRSWITVRSIKPKITKKQVLFYIFVIIFAAVIGHFIGSGLN